MDFTMMYAAHDAFNRDLDRLIAAAKDGRSADPAVRTGWETFKRQLTVHHGMEDEALWPRMRSELAGRSEALAVLDAMEVEHELIDPLLADVDAALDGDSARLVRCSEALAEALGAHLEHEENDALPLVTPDAWAAFIEQGRRQGLRGGAAFFPWLLDGAPADMRTKLLAAVPPPVRLLYRLVWRPRYARTPRWTPA